MALGSGFLLECFRESFLSHWEALGGTKDQCIEVALSLYGSPVATFSKVLLPIFSGYSGHPLMPYDVQSSKHSLGQTPVNLTFLTLLSRVFTLIVSSPQGPKLIQQECPGDPSPRQQGQDLSRVFTLMMATCLLPAQTGARHQVPLSC